VVGLIGVVTVGRLAMICEYVANGNIESYYKQYKLDIPAVLRWSLDACRGM
jgi:hypothetical protein